MRHLLPTQLRSLSYLFQEKDQTLKELIGDLTLVQVREDSDVERVFESIKEQVLLVPVAFQEPELTDDRTEPRQSRGDYMNPTPHTKQIVIMDVIFNFTGSPELFGHSPTKDKWEGTRFYQPDFNLVSIEVEHNQLDKVFAFAEAKRLMHGTFSLINKINPEVTTWSAAKENMIRAAIQKRREDVIKAYGR